MIAYRHRSPSNERFEKPGVDSSILSLGTLDCGVDCCPQSPMLAGELHGELAFSIPRFFAAIQDSIVLYDLDFGEGVLALSCCEGACGTDEPLRCCSQTELGVHGPSTLFSIES